MPSSIKMIKATDVLGGETTAKIDTQIDEEMVRMHHSYSEDSSVTPLKKAQQKGQELLSQAEQKRQQLIEETYQEIEAIKKTAYDEAYQLGLGTGHQEGFQQGLAEGLKQAEIENTQEKEAIQNMQQEAQAEIEQYKEVKKEELIQLASHMAEKIVHKEIDASEKSVLLLAEPYFYQLDKDEEHVSIKVHPTQLKHIREQLPNVEMMAPNTRFMVYGDPKLEDKGIVIESSKAVIDLQIKKQLEAMLQEFDEMERTVNA